MTRTRRVSRLLTDVADYERQDDSHQDARHADEHEGDTQAPQVVDEAADDQPQKGPDRDAEAIKGDGRRPLRGPDGIGDQRMRRRRAARPPYPDANAREAALDVITLGRETQRTT